MAYEVLPPLGPVERRFFVHPATPPLPSALLQVPSWLRLLRTFNPGHPPRSAPPGGRVCPFHTVLCTCRGATWNRCSIGTGAVNEQILVLCPENTHLLMLCASVPPPPPLWYPRPMSPSLGGLWHLL